MSLAAQYETREVTKTTVIPEPPADAPVVTKYFRSRTRERVTLNVLRNAVVYYTTTLAALGVNTINSGLSEQLFTADTTSSFAGFQPTQLQTQQSADSQQLLQTLQQLLASVEKGAIVWVDVSPPTANNTKLANPSPVGKVKAIIIENDPSSSGNAFVGTQVLAPSSAIEIFTDEPNTYIDPTTIIVSPNGNILHISMLILNPA